MNEKCSVMVWAHEPGWLRALGWILSAAGLDVVLAESEAEAVALPSKRSFNVVVLDVCEPFALGADVLYRLRRTFPDLPVVLTSPCPEREECLKRVAAQAFRLIRRPDDLERLGPAVRDASASRGSAVFQSVDGKRNGSVAAPGGNGRAPMPPDFVRTHLVGETSCIQNARRLMMQVAPSDMTVLIRGESGTGKDVVARLIHQLSKRARAGEFVKINCPAIPEALLESELFGHERGAFTGAVAQKPGRFELADGGTIFLDEIGLMSTSMQGKILEVIEHKQFVRVGGKETIRVDARIIAATSAPLEDMIAGGAFRADLFYRLRQFSIALPALRERPEDIPLLCEHFLRQCSAQEGFQHTRLASEVIPYLLAYEWPGNVRELEALMARYALCGDVDALKEALVPAQKAVSGEDRLEAAELATILSVLSECRWNRRQAAVLLGISYSALRRRMAKHGIARSPAVQGCRSLHTW